MAQFFIDRPIFSWVIALIIMIAGGLSMSRLPIARYPTIAPTSVSIYANYPGASAKVVEDSVTQIIEQQMTGLDGLLYMSATSEANGSSTITLTFETGRDPDIAQVQVQNKLQSAMSVLPSAVQQQGLTVTKSGAGFLMVLGFVSDDGRMDQTDISDYIFANLREPLSRIKGVGNVEVFGSQYAMRVWLDPYKLDTYKLSVNDVVGSIQAQNQQVSIGQIGGSPSVPGQEINFSINTRGRLNTPGEFRNIVLRSNTDGSTIHLSDVARVELGAESYGFTTLYNGKTASGVAISLSSGANAIETADLVRAYMNNQKQFFPKGLRAVVPFDDTPFVRVAIEGVLHTLVEAVFLVFVVMFLFLQNWRATLIPTIAIPVVLFGTFGVLSVFGYSINMLTMFAMVLAIGLLVDDAIVVVENVERLMSEEGLSPKEAARKSMGQITGALVGIGVVLSAVFVPMAFLGGATGVIYRQFSVTIVSAMAISVFIAIVFTPALCGTLLRPIPKGHHIKEKGFFGWFNRKFDSGNVKYQHAVRGIVHRKKHFLVSFAALVVLLGYLFVRMPTGFLPTEDQGSFFAMIMGRAGATQEQTVKILDRMQNYIDTDKNVTDTFLVQGFSFGGGGQGSGVGFMNLKPWEERKEQSQSVTAIAGRAGMAFSQIKEAMVFAVVPPPIMELSTTAGFSFFLKDNAGLGHDALMNARNQLLGMAAQDPLLTNVRPNGQEDAPQLLISIDNQKATSLGLNISEINNTLGAAWGGHYIDDFLDKGRVKRVYVQAEPRFRMQPEDFKRWSVRNSNGEMVPFSSFGEATWTYGSPRLERFNGAPALEINGEGASGISSGDAMKEIEKLVSQLPAGFGIEWSGTSYQERQAGNQTTMLYILSLMIVFLALAALYESWSIPTSVLLAAPLGVLGAVLLSSLRGMERDVYFQVAMLTTVGLTSKNAILIVEFAKDNLKSGMLLIDATLAAVRDRLRPILMTSLAFGFGVIPLVFASGAGSGAQNSIGTGVLGGMIVGTILGIFFVPLFFFVIERLFIRRKPFGTNE